MKRGHANDFRHLTEEEGQQQRTDVRTIDVSIRHDNNAVIAQLIRIKLFTTDTTAQGNQCADFG